MKKTFAYTSTALCAAALLAACGGGDSADPHPNPAPSLGLHGSVATGLPVVGAAVSAKCAKGGSAASATTDAGGAYKLDMPGAAAPCMLQATGGTVGGAANTQTLHGFAVAAGVANLTPLTELALAQAAGQPPAQTFAGYDASAGKTLQDKLDAAQTWLKQQFSTLGLALPADVNAFTAPFKADGKDGVDQLLDQWQAILKEQGRPLGDMAAAVAQGKSMANVLGDKAVSVEFAAYAGEAPIQCGEGFKLKGVDMQMREFTLYISNVALIRADGSKVPLKLPADDNYHHTAQDGSYSVSLVDLRQPKGYCSKEAAHHPNIAGSVPAGRYVGAEMTLGVPLPVNHIDPRKDTTPAVLRSTVHPVMGWPWRSGHKFTNIELQQPLVFTQNAQGRYLTPDGNIIVQAVRDAYGKLYDASGNTINYGKIIAPDGTVVGKVLLADGSGKPLPDVIVKNSDDKGVVFDQDGQAITGAKVLDQNGAVVTTVPTSSTGRALSMLQNGLWVEAPGWKVVDANGTRLPLSASSAVSPSKWTLLHLGSTACPAVNGNAGKPGAPAPQECRSPNRLPLSFAQFNPATQVIALDVAALFAHDDVTATNDCMSASYTAECAGPFKALALDWKADGSGNGRPIEGQTQTVFKVVKK